MTDFQTPPPDPHEFYRCRSLLALSPVELGKLLGVSARTIAAWESGEQTIPDARWRHFLHETRQAFTQMAKENPALMVIMSDDGMVPVDVVSEHTYVAHVMAPDGRTGVVASHYIDRQTGKAKMHRQVYLRSKNQGIPALAAVWDDNRRRDLPEAELYAYNMHRWLVRQTLAGVLENPHLEQLRKQIDAASQRVDDATNDEERRVRLAELDKAIAAHMLEVSKVVANAKN